MEIRGGNYLTFLLGEEVYGLPIKKAREIIGMMEITHIPRTRQDIKGVINLRGKIISIIDLRLKFGMDGKDYTERTCIIIIEVESGANQRQVGIVVDAVSEVVNIQKNEIEPAPDYEARIEREFITGLGKIKDKVVLILDMETILNHEELFLIKKEFGGSGKDLIVARDRVTG